jgi:hypothetical protein
LEQQRKLYVEIGKSYFFLRMLTWFSLFFILLNLLAAVSNYRLNPWSMKRIKFQKGHLILAIWQPLVYNHKLILKKYIYTYTGKYFLLNAFKAIVKRGRFDSSNYNWLVYFEKDIPIVCSFLWRSWCSHSGQNIKLSFNTFTSCLAKLTRELLDIILHILNDQMLHHNNVMCDNPI